MKIFVADDKEINRESARQQLGQEHELVLASSFDEVKAFLDPKFDREKEQELLIAAGFPGGKCPSPSKASKEEQSRFWKESDIAHKSAEIPLVCDVALLDMFMPASDYNQGYKGRFEEVEMPYGFPLAFYAAQRGIKHVGILSDMNHHVHPMAAACDPLVYRQGMRELINIGDSRFLLRTDLVVKMQYPAGATCPECNKGKCKRNDGSEYDCHYCDGSGSAMAYAKDWKTFLCALLK